MHTLKNAARIGATFTYTNVIGDEFTLHDPASGECFLLVSGARSAFNGTTSRATVFSEHGCEGSRWLMQPNTSAGCGGNAPHSVMFD
ncbi:hypothetical protein [Streptomyces sp. NPDC018584]|uniref:hypothetical protein n=1 Tax=unclassified Streptomyces TaxID=2593676 RepID=UPI00379D7C12